KPLFFSQGACGGTPAKGDFGATRGRTVVSESIERRYSEPKSAELRRNRKRSPLAPGAVYDNSRGMPQVVVDRESHAALGVVHPVRQASKILRRQELADFSKHRFQLMSRGDSSPGQAIRVLQILPVTESDDEFQHGLLVVLDGLHHLQSLQRLP